jgi:hypothetical protein
MSTKQGRPPVQGVSRINTEEGYQDGLSQQTTPQQHPQKQQLSPSYEISKQNNHGMNGGQAYPFAHDSQHSYYGQN